MSATAGYRLLPPADTAGWQAFHAIRRAELFDAKGKVYDAGHPDDRAASNHPLLLTLHGVPLGCVRLDDFGDGTAAVRLVAVAAAEQRRGHGKALMAGVETLARQLGLHTLCVNSAPDAVGFYEKTGWEPFIWSAAELAGTDCVQMRKRLG